MAKRSLPLAKVYGLLEPGPVVLLATASGDESNVMTLSWHSMLEFEPPLIGCVISDRNHSYSLLCASRECTVNIPTVDLVQKVVNCGNATGRRTDKFRKFGLTPTPGKFVRAPLIDECYASLECRVVDTSMVATYSFFVLKVVKAWIDPAVEHPRTLHHLGRGTFMVAGETIKLPSRMR